MANILEESKRGIRLQLNPKKTDELAADMKYQLYLQWAKDNGVIMDKVGIVKSLILIVDISSCL
jgi:hypothetical protein